MQLCSAVLKKFNQLSGTVITDGDPEVFCCKKGINTAHSILIEDRLYRLCGGTGHTQDDRPAVHYARGEDRGIKEGDQVNLVLPGTVHGMMEQLGFPTEGIIIESDYTDMLDEFTAASFNEEDNVTRIMVTGHTVISNEGLLEERLTLIMQDYINRLGIENIIAVSGGALGADRLWALVAYKLGVRFEIYVPRGYENVFIAMERYNHKSDEARQKDLARFSRMLSLASGVFDENGNPREDSRYQRGANFKRNATMVRVSQHCVAVSREDPRTVITHRQSGGTFNAIREWKWAGNTRINWVEVPQCNVHLNLEF